MSASPDKQAAEQILEDLELLSHLGGYGEVQVVGSVALDLIVKPDLDLHLLIASDDLMPTAHTVTEYLLDQDKIREVRLTDWRKNNGLKLGVDAYPAPSGDWSIDIWITNDPGTTAFEVVRILKTNLTDAHRELILSIKSHFHQQGLVRDGLSLKIYNAVMEQGVTTVDAFINLLQSGDKVV